MARRATLPMILALAITFVGFFTLIFVKGITSPPLAYGAAYAGVLLGLYILVRIMLPHADALLLPIVTLLTGVGLVMIFRLTYDVRGIENLATTQVVWILIGSAAMLLVILLFRNYERLLEYKYLIGIVAILFMASVATPLGYEVNGARLWLHLGPVNIQPSEFAKIALIIFYAGYLADKREVMAATSRSFLGMQIPALKYFGPVAVVWGASLLLLVVENDLGDSLLFFAVPLLMLYVATGRMAYIVLGGILFGIGAYAAYNLFGHVQLRVIAWLNPWPHAQDQCCYQVVQSLFNIADGGITGTGLGEGFAQTIPDVQTDFIFASVASELGLLGASALLLVFLAFVYRGIKIAMLATDPAAKLLAFGLTAMFALQTLIIVGGVTKAIPLTGVTLPFVSYGGSSIVGNFILTGLLLVISEHAGKQHAAARDEYYAGGEEYAG